MRLWICQVSINWSSMIVPFVSLGIPELMRLHAPCWPVEAEQPLEMIVAADVVATDAVPVGLPGPVRVAAEGKGDPLRVPGHHRLDGAVAAEGVPQQTVQRRR